MTQERANEIERKLFYQHAESIMQIIERCKDTHLVFQIGIEMGIFYKDLSKELIKEIESSESE